MATKLNQIIAVEKGAKVHLNETITGVYHEFQKPDLFAGLARSYRPKDDDGDQLPPESTKVQRDVTDLLDTLGRGWGRLLDVTATKDWANTQAVADVKVGDTVIIAKAPATYLIWLEKQVAEMRTVISRIPTLDPALDWTRNDAADAWASTPVETTRTRKVMRAFTKAPATKEHPAQVDSFTEDEVAGYWTNIRFSGALPQASVNELLERVDALAAAVKTAREEANMIDVTDISVGGALFGYLFAT